MPDLKDCFSPLLLRTVSWRMTCLLPGSHSAGVVGFTASLMPSQYNTTPCRILPCGGTALLTNSFPGWRQSRLCVMRTCVPAPAYHFAFTELPLAFLGYLSSYRAELFWFDVFALPRALSAGTCSLARRLPAHGFVLS